MSRKAMNTWTVSDRNGRIALGTSYHGLLAEVCGGRKSSSKNYSFLTAQM